MKVTHLVSFLCFGVSQEPILPQMDGFTFCFPKSEEQKSPPAL